MRLFNNFLQFLFELKTYIQYLRTIKKNRNTPEFQRLKLRTDWFGRIYTVVNLRKEDLGTSEEFKRELINRKLARPIYDYLTMTLNLAEIIHTELEYIDGGPDFISYSYLVKFNFTFQFLNLWYLIKVSAFLYSMYYLFFRVLNIEYWFGLVIQFLSQHNIIK